MTDYPDDIDLSPGDSLLFWAVVALAIFAVSGFCAGLIYPIFM